uniref:uncharacterized protein LOC122609831 n=1 Tax=Erigeron canadensis TaxID=72917 RepID=UPI001CB92FBF|nr:uncharacterized protein LOC122609831 [Erigeron canadensis]
MSMNLGNCYDLMYNLDGYYYGMNNFAYDLAYYPYHRLYQSWYDFYNTYPYQTSYNYGNTPDSSKPFYTYKNTTPIVVKKKTNVKDGDDSEVAKQNASLFSGKGETKNAHLRSGESNDDESVGKDVLLNGESEGLNSCYNGEIDRGYAEAIEALSLYDDGSDKQVGADGQPSLCTAVL